MKHVSELRQDLVTGDWVVVATGRAHRPNEYARHRRREKPQPKRNCPFEQLLPSALLAYDRAGVRFPADPRSRIPSPAERRALKRSWWLQVVPNKFPAFGEGMCGIEQNVGPFRRQDGVGFHEVVITRHHTRSLGAMSTEEAGIVVRSYLDRYRALAAEDCVEYIAIFHNHGREAGATISHPHSQIIAIPVVPPDVGRSLKGASEYYRKHRRCVHCTMLGFEERQGWRIVYANNDFIALCPYVSRQAFEIRIFPRRHSAEFESMTDGEVATCAEALRRVLGKLGLGLGDPPYNFFIHTAPATDGSRAPYYHWHIEIIPKTAIWAGFEIGTGIEISTISPEAAAKFLRTIRV